METQSGRGWLVNAFSIFLLVLSLWILAALWAGSTFGASFPLLADLRSQIFANYGSDALGRTLKSLQLTILGDINGGLSFGDGSNADWNQSFQGLVPTVTQPPTYDHMKDLANIHTHRTRARRANRHGLLTTTSINVILGQLVLRSDIGHTQLRVIDFLDIPLWRVLVC